MANTFTISGRLTGDPELRFTQNGKAVATFTVADNHRKKVGSEWQDDGTTFIRVSVWEGLAENLVDRFSKGDMVSASGELRQQDWVDKEGNKRTAYELRARTVAEPVPSFVSSDRSQPQASSAPF